MFPSPGNHQWPDNQVKLRACATSGLPVTYHVGGGESGEGCGLDDPAATTLRSQGLIDCDITAMQAGNSEFAPAKSITRHWHVGRMAATIAIIGPLSPLRYTGPGSKVTVTIRVTSKHPLPALNVNVTAEEPCSYDGAPTIGDSTAHLRNVTMTFVMHLGGPGQCELKVHLQSNSLSDGNEDRRTYTVRGTTS